MDDWVISMKKQLNLNNFGSIIATVKVFLFLSVIFGIVFVFVIPPFQAPDEPAHFFRSYQISKFELVGQKVGDDSGGYIPKKLVDMQLDLSGHIAFNISEKFSNSKLKKYLNNNEDFKDRQFVDFRNTAMYSPVAYIPQVLGFVTAEKINLSPLFLIYFGRLFNLLFFIVLTYFAIKIAPIFRWGYVLLALMPMTIHQAASLSADGFCFGLSFLFVAYILNCALIKEKICNKKIGLIFLLTILLSLCKSAYFFMIILYLIIPSNKFSSRLKYYVSFLLITVFSAIASVAWAYFASKVYLPMCVDANPQVQLINMFLHPQYFIAALFQSFFKVGVLHSFVGNLGWLDNPLPLTLVFLYLVALISAVFFDGENIILFSMRQRIVILTTFVLCFISIQTLLYLSCSKVASNYVVGAQGRYFIPIAALFLLFFHSKFASKNLHLNRVVKLVFFCLLLFMLVATAIFIIKRYYVFNF